MDDLPLRIAHGQTIDGLLEVLNRVEHDDLPDSDDISFTHLRWMMNRCRETLLEWPTDKTSRWIGNVQGVMRCRGVLDYSAERDRTRPFYHAAYKAMGYSIPETADREIPQSSRLDELTQTGHDSDRRLDEAVGIILSRDPEIVRMFELNSEKTLTILTGRVMQFLKGAANPEVIKTRLTVALAR